MAVPARALPASPPLADLAEIGALLDAAYGIEGGVAALGGERDGNYLVTADGGRQRYVLKMIAGADAAEMQARLLLHLARADPSLPVPRLRPARRGLVSQRWRRPSGGTFSALLLDFLPGRFLAETPTNETLREVGRALGRLDRALAFFSDPAAARPLIWDLCRAHETRPSLAAVADPRARALADWGLDLFRRLALPQLPGLRRQIIHADPNPHNILVRGRGVRGIIDFGDAIAAPLINEPAIAAAYHLALPGSPLAGALGLLAGFHEACPLAEEEINLLFPLMAGRLAATVAITAANAARQPHNARYILKNASAAVAGLSALHAIGFASGRARIHAALAEGARG